VTPKEKTPFQKFQEVMQALVKVPASEVKVRMGKRAKGRDTPGAGKRKKR
jgi:hypothetical protein